jgi:Putative zinc-finger
MRCEDSHPLLLDHVRGTLPPEISTALTEHLRTCRACTAEVDGLIETWQGLGAVASDVADSPGMRSRFEAMLRRAADNERIEKTSQRRVAWLSVYGREIAALVAALVIGVGIGRQTMPSPASASQLTIMRAELVGLRQMVTLSLLQHPSASDRLNGVNLTTQIERPGDELTTALLDTLLHDPNVNVRLASIDALKRFAARDDVRRGVAATLRRQVSPLVQIAVIDFIIETNVRDAADSLRRVSSDPGVDPAVRGRARQALLHIG